MYIWAGLGRLGRLGWAGLGRLGLELRARLAPLIRRAANAAPRGVLDHQECLRICLGKRYTARASMRPPDRAGADPLGGYEKTMLSFGSGGVAAAN